MLHCLRLIKLNFASNNLNENPKKKFISFPPSNNQSQKEKTFLLEKDYGLQFFMTQRTLLSLSMEGSRGRTDNGWVGMRIEEWKDELCEMYTRIRIYDDDKHKKQVWKINDFFAFYCWFLWFRKKSIFAFLRLNSSLALCALRRQCIVKYASQAEEILIFIMHVNLAVWFLLFSVSRSLSSFLPRAFFFGGRKQNFFDLFDVHLLPCCCWND